jgi:hypothetical protein
MKEKSVEEDRIEDLEALARDILESQEHVAQLHLVHLPGLAELIIHTSETDLQEEYGSYLRINTDSGEVLLSLTITLTQVGPGHLEGDQETTLYTDESVIGANGRNLDEGLDIVRMKLG